jgi:hypothetical protein
MVDAGPAWWEEDRRSRRAYVGRDTETALHRAASSDGVELIGGGTALAGATAFSQWRAAVRLLEPSAHTNLFRRRSWGSATGSNPSVRRPRHQTLNSSTMRCGARAMVVGRRRPPPPRPRRRPRLTPLDAAERSARTRSSPGYVSVGRVRLESLADSSRAHEEGDRWKASKTSPSLFVFGSWWVGWT